MKQGIVLIADDDEIIRTMYKTAFELAGLTALTARDGNEAVAVALEHHPDVILMDILMPELSGHAAVDAIRKDAWGKHAKIIYLTNLSDAENVVNAVERDSEEYIIKANSEVKEVINQARMAMHAD